MHPNAVVHMLSGKAIARAVRGHFIVDAALNALMLHSEFDAPLPCQPDMSDSNDMLIQTLLKLLHQMKIVADVGKNRDCG